MNIDHIGERVRALSALHEITGTIVGGTGDDGQWTRRLGDHIDIDGLVDVLDDDGNLHRLCAWLFTFETLKEGELV